MNRSKLKILIIFIIGLLLCLSINCTSKKDRIYDDKNNETNNNFVAMMIETGAGTGKYVQSNSNNWLVDGYVFNSELSGCENEGTLSWDDSNKKIIIQSNTTDKCYVYFDKYNVITINDYSINSSGNKIIISISASSGTGTISKYFYSKDDGITYVESVNSTYNFTNLDKGSYKIKAFVLDSNNKKSEVLSKTVEIKGIQLSEYIKSQYTGTQGGNGLYYHDSSLTNGAGDNSYRYAGSDPNNYVCFGSDESSCSIDNLYRVIGVFDGRVKLIKADYTTNTLLGIDGDYKGIYSSSTSTYKGSLSTSSIGEYYWNYKNNTTINNGFGTNTWSTSLLNTTNLNVNYLNNIGSKWANMIDTTTWIVGGNVNFDSQIPSVVYQNEIKNPSSNVTYVAKVGLMYASDYGFAADSSAWSTTLFFYGTSSITDKNWIHIGLNEWILSRNSGGISDVYYLSYNGILTTLQANNAYSVRPVSYLKDSVVYVQGSGTKNDPIRIDL